MRKIISITAIILVLILALPGFALATVQPETQPQSLETGETPPPQNEESGIPVNLSIDNANVYEGMDRAYKDGYTPTVKNGKAIVVVPLLLEGELLNNKIIATPTLGDPMFSPFVYKNLQKTVELKDNLVQGGIEVSSFLVRFDLDLSSDRYNGVYSVSIDVQARSKDGAPLQQSFTCYVTINDGKDPNPPEPETEPEPEPEPPVSQPKILVDSYMTEPSPIVAGEEFVVKATLKNTSDKESVQNMTVTATVDSASIALISDSDTVFISKLSRGDTADIKFSYKADLDTAPQRYSISLNITYDNSDAMTLSSSGTVPITVSQPLRVKLDAPKVPAQVNAGDTLPLSFQVMNLGRGRVYNVRCQLEAPGLLPISAAFMGNLEPGTSVVGDMDVFVGMKDMSDDYEGDEKYGYTSGYITLIYEDENANEYTEEIEVYTNINEPVIRDTEPENVEEPERAGQWWISLIIGGIVILALVIYLLVNKNRRIKEDKVNLTNEVEV